MKDKEKIAIVLTIFVVSSIVYVGWEYVGIGEVLLSGVSGNTASQAAEREYPHQEINGISFDITEIKMQSGVTNISFSLSNHMYDLSQFNLKENSSLADVIARDYVLLTNTMGGHHITAQLVFSGYRSGNLQLSLQDIADFNVQI